jgi:hypothetical protein
MAKAITQIDNYFDVQVETVLKAAVAAYSGTKTAGDYGVLTWDRAEKKLIQAAIRKNRKGNTGFRGDVRLASTP